MAEPDDAGLANLAARIAAGESVDASMLPEGQAQSSEVRKLLRFSNVAERLLRNADSRSTPTEMPERIGAWRLVRLLGTGGMGDVWLGERADGTVEHRVAIKRVRGASPAFSARLEVERRILATLSHANIARFIDAGVDSFGSPWLAIEYIDGENLDTWLAREQPTLQARLALYLKVCAAVEHAHRHLVVHRDIKPANILVDADGQPHLLDFGIAKLLANTSSETTAMGFTPTYAAPEQLRSGTISTATDVYALGLILYWLLAGALPPSRQQVFLAELYAGLDDEETQRPSETAKGQSLPYPTALLAGDLDAIVSKTIRKDPAARYGTVAELSLDLQRHIEGRPVEAREPTRLYRLSRFARRHKLPFAFGMAAAVALIGGSTVALWQARVAQVAAQAKTAEAERADREATSARAQAQRAKRSAAFVLSVFEQADLLRRDGRGAISIDEAFEDALKRIDKEFADDAMVAADLHDNFGEILASKGRFDEAQAHLRQALELAEKSHGKDSLEVAESLLNLGIVSSYRGRPLEGSQELERALDILTRHPDTDPLELANARASYSNVLGQNGQSVLALSEMEAALALYRAHLPEGDQRVSISVFNMGAQLHSDGDWLKAQPYLDEALALAEKYQGRDSASLLPILDFQATNLDAIGRHEEAEQTLIRMLAIADPAFPQAHPLRAGPTMELGYHQLRQGRIEEGASMIRRGITMAGELQSPTEIFGWRWLGMGMLEHGRWSEARAAAQSGQALCARLERQAQSRCIDLRLLGVLASIGADPALPVDDEIDAIAADIDGSRVGGDAPSLLLRVRAEQSLAKGDRATALTSFAALHAAQVARYGKTHREVARTGARIVAIKSGEN